MKDLGTGKMHGYRMGVHLILLPGMCLKIAFWQMSGMNFKAHSHFHNRK